MPHPTPKTGPTTDDADLNGLTAVDVADLLLFTVAGTDARALVLEPDEHEHSLRVDVGGTWVSGGSITSSLADAVVARLAILGDLAVGEMDNRLGRVRLRVHRTPTTPAAQATEVLLAIRATEAGLSAEVHALAKAPLGVSERPMSPDAEQTADLSDGTMFGKYRVLDELGRGGMGVVYRAEHVVLQKQVALKILHADAARNPMLGAQLIIEGRAASRARHPGIVEVTDFGTSPDGRAYIVMELVEAPTLATVLKHGPLDPRRAVVLTKRIATALRAPSSQGVVHRDLTPANIFVEDGDRPKIGDFGVARIIDPGGQARPGPLDSKVVGTAAYMSPEQADGHAVDVRSDIYALGCVMFKMLTGHVPYSGTTLMDVIMKHRAAPVPDIVGPHGPVPAGVDRVVRRALAKSPAERYQTLDEMLSDLTHASRALSRGDWRRWLPK
jgi:hypothetical protein